MQSSDKPALIPIPFANAGTKRAVPTMATGTVSANQPSLELGFPSVTMIPKTAGGIPPAGPDFNGVFNLLSSANRWSQAGGLYPYNSAFSTSIGGYPKSALLLSSDGVTVWQSTVENNTTDPDGSSPSGWQKLVGAPGRPSLADKLRDLVHIKDFGAPDTGLTDEATQEASGLSLATSLRSLFGSLWMWKLPKRGLKTWKSTFGIKDQATVVSVSLGDDSAEPVTQVVGFASDADVSGYPDRDHCAMFVQAIAPPTLVTTSATTFTATSVTSTDFTAPIAAGKIKKGMMIDTGESPTKKTGTIVSATGSTITVSGWYIVDGSRTTGTPAAGKTVHVNPSTKVWAHNANVWLNAGSHASNVVGFELGLFNYKGADLGYLYDAINLGTYRGQGAFQCRGSWVSGFYAYAGTEYGFVAQSASGIGFYTNGTTRFGFQSDGSSIAALLAKNCAGQAVLVQDVAGNNLSWIDGSGRLNRSKVFRQIFTNGQTINDFVTYAHMPVLSSATTISLPSPAGLNTDRMIYLHNPPSSTVTVTFAGSVESGTGSITVAPGVTRMIVSDGTYWMG